MIHRRVSILVLAAALVTPIAASAQGGEEEQEEGPSLEGVGSGTVTFYGHVFNHQLGGPSPSNTAPPIGEDNYGLGSFHYCPPSDCRESSVNTLALFSTAGFVDVDNREEFNSEGGYALLHNERGQTQDILLDTDQQIEVGMYGTVDAHSWTVGGDSHGSFCLHEHPPDVPCVYPYWGWDPGAQPDYVVEGTLYKAELGERGANASEAPPVEEAIQEGEAEIIAQDQWGPDTVMNGFPGAPNVNHFQFNLGSPEVDQIDKEEDFIMVYRFYSESAGQAWGYHSWRIWSGEFFPPTYEIPTLNAFTVERVEPEFAHGKLAVLGIMNTPWGSYDVDPDSVELQVEGPTGEFTPETVDKQTSRSVAHGGHFQPVNATWIWDYRADDVQPGAYEITVSATNIQASAESTCSASFELAENEQSELVPGDSQTGTCGFQTITEDVLEQLKRGAEEEAEDE